MRITHLYIATWSRRHARLGWSGISRERITTQAGTKAKISVLIGLLFMAEIAQGGQFKDSFQNWDSTEAASGATLVRRHAEVPLTPQIRLTP